MPAAFDWSYWPRSLKGQFVIICAREYETVNDKVLAQKGINCHLKVIMLATQVFHGLQHNNNHINEVYTGGVVISVLKALFM